MRILVAYAWIALPQPRCVVREMMGDVPGRCLVWVREW